jgi:hypothetical protein
VNQNRTAKRVTRRTCQDEPHARSRFVPCLPFQFLMPIIRLPRKVHTYPHKPLFLYLNACIFDVSILEQSVCKAPFRSIGRPRHKASSPTMARLAPATRAKRVTHRPRLFCLVLWPPCQRLYIYTHARLAYL